MHLKKNKTTQEGKIETIVDKTWYFKSPKNKNMTNPSGQK